MVVGSVLWAGREVQANVKNLFFLSVIHTENVKGLLGLKRNAKEKKNVSFPEAGCLSTCTQTRVPVPITSVIDTALPDFVKLVNICNDRIDCYKGSNFVKCHLLKYSLVEGAVCGDCPPSLVIIYPSLVAAQC